MSPSCACLVYRYVYPSIFTTRSNLVCVMSWPESIKGKKEHGFSLVISLCFLVYDYFSSLVYLLEQYL